MTEIETRVHQVFANIFDREDIELKREFTAADVEDWDSLNHVRLMVALQKEFAIKLQTAEFVNIKNVGELYDTIEKKLAAKA